MRIIYLHICVVILFACKEEKCDRVSDYKEIEVSIDVEHLENRLSEFQTVDDVLLFLAKNRTMADYFLDANQYPNDTILARRIFRLFQQPSIDSLIFESKDYFKNLDANIAELESAYKFIKYHYPETVLPRVQTVVSGLYNDMYVSDSLIIVGIDYFMGMNGRNHPNDIPIYIVKRYMKESLVPIVMSFISNEFNQIDQKHNTLMADMINLGKSYYFVSEAMPCKADSLIIGYTAEEIRLVRENQEVIWANLIENELLYETDHFLKNKFVGESPNVIEISEKCPGRIGAWIGWEIVKKYMDENPEISFTDLMKETDTHKIFQLSRYKPRNQY